MSLLPQQSSQYRRTLIGMAVVVASGAATAALAAPNPYKKPHGTVGNIIFSSEELPKGGEASYKFVKTKFTSPEKIHARAYFVKPVSAYEDLGKLYNSLRAEKRLYGEVKIFEAGKEPLEPLIMVKYPQDDSTRGWETQRWDIGEGIANADFKHPDTRQPLDIEREVRKLAQQSGKPLPFTAKVVLGLTVIVADTSKREWNESYGRYDDNRQDYYHYIARDTFEYTVK